MRFSIQEYSESHIEAVRRFDNRLNAGGMPMAFPLSPVSAWLPKIPGRRIYRELYVAVDGEGEVRGGYMLKHQDFRIKDEVVPIACLELPISEGTVDRRYAHVGVQVLRDALHRQPLLFGLGMGGYQEAVVRLLRAAGWSMFTVPFFFRVVHPTTFLRKVTYLRRSRFHRLALDAIACSGLGWLGIRGAQLLRGPARVGSSVRVERVEEFTDWADDLWESYRDEYGMAAVRTAEALRMLYPKETSRAIRLKVSIKDRTIGFAVLLDTLHEGHKFFGNMRLGSIVSCFGCTANAATVVRASAAYLESQGVDLIVSNHSHVAWQRGFRQAGFWRGPSNFIFASSKALTSRLQRAGLTNDDLHFNRGDGDGPINL